MTNTLHSERVFFKFHAYVCILLEKNNKFLLIHRSNTGWMDGFWNIPGGAVEENESLKQAAAREAQEELGIIISVENLQLFHVRDVLTNNKKAVGFYFICQNWQGEPINNEPERHSEINWFSTADLPKEVTDYAKKAIESYQDKMQFTLIDK